MQYSQDAIDLARESEGLRLTAYQNPGDKPTIGYGHTAGVKLGDTISEARAMALLRMDLLDAANAVNRLVKVPLAQCQFDALCDFVFNEGEGHLAGSTLLKLLNAGDYLGAAKEFPKWNLSAGKVEPGLVKRRAVEAALFLSQPTAVPGSAA